METIKDLDSLYEILSQGGIVIVEAGSGTCNPCAAIKERLSLWLRDHKEIKGFYVPIEEFPEIGAKEGIFSAPAVLVYVNGKAAIRESGYFSLDALLEKTLRYENFLK